VQKDTPSFAPCQGQPIFSPEYLFCGLVALALLQFVRLVLSHWYYPGGTLMTAWCWARHPVNRAKRGEAGYDSGFWWEDPKNLLN